MANHSALLCLTYSIFVFSAKAQKQALIVGQIWKSNIGGLDRLLTVTSVNYQDGTFAGTYGMRNSFTDELRGTFDKDGGNLIGWTVAYRNGYTYDTQVWSGHFVNNPGTNQLAIESLSVTTAPGRNPPYIISEYFIQSSEEEFYTNTTYRRGFKSLSDVTEGQVWVNSQRDEVTITKVNSGNGTFAGVFKRLRDKASGDGYGIRGEVGKDGSTLGWSVIYIYEDPQKLNYRNSIAWCGHIDLNPASKRQEIHAAWLNTTEYKQLQNYIVSNMGFDKFVLKTNKTITEM